MCNPVAWNKGMVMAKCGGCDKWHKLRDEGNLVDVNPETFSFLLLVSMLLLVRCAIVMQFTTSTYLLR